jgi:hypothetical protein
MSRLCDYCGHSHAHRFCDRVKSVEFEGDGYTIKRIELEPVRPQPPVDLAEVQAALQAAEGRLVVLSDDLEIISDAAAQIQNDAKAAAAPEAVRIHDPIGDGLERQFMSGSPACEPILPRTAKASKHDPGPKLPPLERAKMMAKVMKEAEDEMGPAALIRALNWSELTVYKILNLFGPKGCPSAPCFSKGRHGWYLTAQGGKVLL